MWSIPYPMSEQLCDCHFFCIDGSKPGDCQWVQYNYSGGLDFPMGARSSNLDYGDDRMHAWGYCNTHHKYMYRQPQIIYVDWEEFKKERIIPGERRSYWKVA